MGSLMRVVILRHFSLLIKIILTWNYGSTRFIVLHGQSKVGIWNSFKLHWAIAASHIENGGCLWLLLIISDWRELRDYHLRNWTWWGWSTWWSQQYFNKKKLVKICTKNEIKIGIAYFFVQSLSESVEFLGWLVKMIFSELSDSSCFWKALLKVDDSCSTWKRWGS